MPSNVTLFVSLLLICAVLNHLRGGGHGFGELVAKSLKKLPGRPLYYVAVVLGLVVLVISRNPMYAAIVAFGYFLWGVGPWGRMLDMGNLEHENSRRGEPLSDLVLRMLPPGRGADALAMFVRELYVLPFLVMAYWYVGGKWYSVLVMAIFYPAGAITLRMFAMRQPNLPSNYRNFMAEISIGLLWGALIGGILIAYMR